MPEIIDLDQTEDFKPKEIHISSPKKTHFGAIVGLFLTLIFLGGIAFGIGWLASMVKNKISSAPSQIEGKKEATSSAQVEGWIGYSDKENNFSIAYPPEWVAQAHEEKEPAGVLLSFENSSIDIWIKIDKAVAFSDEQKAGLKTSENKTMDFQGRPALLTINAYQAGNFFNILVLPATETKPQVTFWIKAEDEEFLATQMKIIDTFRFD